ncbi:MULTISPECIES: glutamate synthase-related protein [Mycobacteriaceae]|uniref:glutamate synthase-related protein n=1 Tax=Mycobacteriaceae TaxID=1762 RepID=UPI0009DB70E7|nr:MULTISPECIES: glutamate synthase-related protein [Mycobacteriaceae]AXK75983.1 hypothetical protein DXK33_13615 [Mycolicibacterium neoaurum]
MSRFWRKNVTSKRFPCADDAPSPPAGRWVPGGQAAENGTGGHLSGKKVVGKIVEVHGLAPGTDAISPARFPDWTTVGQYADFAAEVHRAGRLGAAGDRMRRHAGLRHQQLSGHGLPQRGALRRSDAAVSDR